MKGSLMLDIAGTWLTAADRQLLRQPEVGGLILFARNIEDPRQVRELCLALRAERPDLLIAVDQEGGRVQRLRNGFVTLPSMGALAAHGDETLARHCGWLMACEVLAAGIDFSFAPVLDLDHGRSSVIGARSFGRDPAQVIRLAGAFIDGMHEAGMAATGKHFPGHGWPVADSHVAIPRDERDLQAIRNDDLQPFAALAPRLEGLMPAHVIYTAVDSQPAGFSRRWLQEILRGELGYRGVIFSDDLSMAGAHVAGDAAARVQAALEAGCDMALVCNDRAAAEQALTALQRLRVSAPAGLSAMAARGWPGNDYRAQPRWQQALQALRAAALID
ncbi:beta-N-acetylhexosaminidase [Pseudomonas sp. NW5]|uniref:beta-N-acetylhexosaminidase n=1 Tax=Pseudomonas sp. NW5 TaxID=2934934 RepID=UPI002021A102|nr:beta-N-acetylhexosaminidase [Pseudomonas sp. NW5]MCL7461659.1 beta-N-acetylhexosaminidase [Pseudomonas sp. NW5]